MMFRLTRTSLSAVILLVITSQVSAQDSTEVVQPVVQEVRLAKNTFESVWVMDNQTCIVPKKGSLEMDIQHRFGTVNNGAKDMFGLFAPSNIRLGLSFVVINRLNLGAGLHRKSLQTGDSGHLSIDDRGQYHQGDPSVGLF